MKNKEMKTFYYEHKPINSKCIISDARYQRQVDFSRVKKIVADFNPNLVNEVKVSYRDGKYYVFDGQHTTKALVLRNNNRDLMIECKVYYDMPYEEEARLFALQNGTSRKVESSDKLKALYEARDIDVVDFYELVNSTGIVCDFNKKAQQDGVLICHSCAYKIFIKYGKEHLKEVLSIINESWDGEATSLRREIVNGISLFVHEYKNQYDRNILVSKLSNVSPSFIIREGNAYSTSGNKKFARQVLNIYNNKMRSNRLPDRF